MVMFFVSKNENERNMATFVLTNGDMILTNSKCVSIVLSSRSSIATKKNRHERKAYTNSYAFNNDYPGTPSSTKINHIFAQGLRRPTVRKYTLNSYTVLFHGNGMQTRRNKFKQFVFTAAT